MKTLNIFILGLIISYGLLIGCTKEDTEIKSIQVEGVETYIPNQLEITGVSPDTLSHYGLNSSYGLNQGFMIYKDKVDSSDAGYYYEIWLVSSGHTIYDDGVKIDSIKGTGEYINLKLYNTSSNGSISGTYNYDSSGSGVPMKFNEAEIGIGVNFFTGQITAAFDNIISGTLNITPVGTNYELNFYSTHSDSPGLTITAYYKGFIKYLHP